MAVREENDVLGGCDRAEAADRSCAIGEFWKCGFCDDDESRLTKGLDVARVGPVGKALAVRWHVITGAAGRRVVRRVNGVEDSMAPEGLVEFAGGEGRSSSCEKNAELAFQQVVLRGQEGAMVVSCVP